MIIESFLDLDRYKLTMMQAALHHFPAINAKYQFVNRSKNIDLVPFYDEIVYEINSLAHLFFRKSELKYLRSVPYFTDDFIDLLRFFKLYPEKQVKINTDNDKLNITIEGTWFHVILYETLILSIVSEVYNRNVYNFENLKSMAINKIDEKILLLKKNPIKLIEFGTRRRFSRTWQRSIINSLTYTKTLRGTSNVRCAMDFDIKVIGTMAHEWFQAMQAVDACSLKNCQKYALDIWAKEYRGYLGIALTDTLGINAFINDFDMYFAKLYDGVRHDSGDPCVWMTKILQHYQIFGIDSKTKTAIFSDNLNIPKAIELHNMFDTEINTMFGIGTNLTNDIPAVQSLSIVIKMIQFNGKPVAKISDEPGKEITGCPEFLKDLKRTFSIHI